MSRPVLFFSAVAAVWGVILPANAGGPTPRASLQHSTDRLIVKLRDDAEALQPARLDELSKVAGVSLSVLRRTANGAYVLRTRAKMAHALAQVLAERLHFRPDVMYAEVDVLLEPQRTPNDSLFSSQWHYFEPAGGVGLPAAWDLTIGSNAITVAVIDSGVAAHADVAGRAVPGYDFISSAAIANDGDGRDVDASDPGDWVTAAESSSGFFAGCGVRSSSWHGTHVAGTVAATTNNGVGVSGINWASKLLPVRVLGKCGGYLSDVADAMRWAAGLPMAGTPVNANPARVLNLSLGGSGACSATLQSAVDSVIAAGAVVVAAAGNSAGDAANFQPASCNGVIAVGATTSTGARASYSNFGAAVAISAPGSGVLSTANTGAFGPESDTYLTYSGTSMATPHVTGIVSLMLSVNPSLTPAEVRTKLLGSARPFPIGTENDCAIGVCGAGIADGGAAVLAASPQAAATISASPTNIPPGGTVTATWSGIATPSSSDWVGLYVPGTAPTAYLDWIYVSCSKAASAARSAGTCSFVLPASLALGTYELRLFANNGYTELAKSAAFTVAGSSSNVSLSVAPASVAAGGTVTADWSGIAAPRPRDWIGLYAPGAAATAYIEWIYVSCSKAPVAPRSAGSCPFTLPASLAPGSYELRLLADDGYAQLTVSNAFTVIF